MDTWACQRGDDAHRPGAEHHAHVRGTGPLGSTFGGPANWSSRVLAVATSVEVRCCCGWEYATRGPLHADVVDLHARWQGHAAGKALEVAADYIVTRHGLMRREYAAEAHTRGRAPVTCAADATHKVWRSGWLRWDGVLRLAAAICDHEWRDQLAPAPASSEPADLLELLALIDP